MFKHKECQVIMAYLNLIRAVGYEALCKHKPKKAIHSLTRAFNCDYIHLHEC